MKEYTSTAEIYGQSIVSIYLNSEGEIEIKEIPPEEYYKSIKDYAIEEIKAQPFF